MLFQLLFFSGSIFLIEGQSIIISLAGNGSTSHQGRVEITRNNITGTVCKDKFNDNAATVVCRQLGFPGDGTAINDTNRFGAGTGPIWLDDVTCAGNERNIEQCTFRSWNQSDCTHNDDVGVICSDTSPTSTPTTRAPIIVQPSNCNPQVGNLNTRLIGPDNLIGVGFVEILRNGQWGSICDDLWGKQDARVICHMLCFDPAIAQAGAPIDIDHGKVNVSERFHLDDVECIGNETDIDQCKNSSLGNHNCDVAQQEYASVTCIKLQDTRLAAPIPDLYCADGKFNIQFSRIQDPYLKEEHLSIFSSYIGPCNMKMKNSTNFITVTIPYTDCGTKVILNVTEIIYLNTIKYDYTLVQDEVGGQIVRVNTYKVEVCCIFPRDLEINKGFTLLPESIKKKAPGNFSIIMTFYNDSFITSLNEPVELILGQWLNVALKLEDTEGHPDLKLIVPNCTARPTDDPDDPVYFKLFSEKCAEDPTLGFFPLNSTTFGFRYQTFKFYMSKNVYIHCNAWVCLTTEKNHDCDRTCNLTTSTGRRKRDVSSRDVYQLMSQPLKFKQLGDNSLIDRGGGWQVDLATTQRPSTLSATSTMNMRSTKPSTPLSTVNPTGTTSKYIKVIDVGSSTPDAFSVTESATMKRTSTPSQPTKSQTKVQIPTTTKQMVSGSPTTWNGLTSTIVKPNISHHVKTKTSTSSPSNNSFKMHNSTIKLQTTSTTKPMVSGLPTSRNGFNLTTEKQTFQNNDKTKTSTLSPPNRPIKSDNSAVTTQVKLMTENIKNVPEPNKLYYGGFGGKFTILSEASRPHVSTYAVIFSMVCGLFLVLR
ncbi:deleted in malignant brain tumors 1 protein-like [Mytilus californianus]|uniref:deleted in malignant brain tumors 1 protein-like n=1 Tax=Mytilus californianus TaxID=6549 RepID=UPI002246475A|nr:deleted in malignant brain tumors 1 protein-like [Mytilus californianus]